MKTNDEKMISDSARSRAEDFLKISGQFRLGDLVTESSHPITANLSDVARKDISAALDLLFRVDADVIARYREWVETGRAQEIASVVLKALLKGGRIFFTGCGATGRLSILLDSIWRGFWQKHSSSRRIGAKSPSSLAGEGWGEDENPQWEDRTISLMAGGDFALIKSVEGFEDITEFGKRQIEDTGVGPNDVVFAITEGGETSWVIGTAWKALEKGAKVFFVYNNPDDILRKRVERSREIIDEPRIEKINLTTGPMAVTGSTRMQATTIQLCVLVTILEMVVRNLLFSPSPLAGEDQGEGEIPWQFLEALELLHQTFRSEPVLRRLATLVEMEESVYRNGGRVNYFADQLAIDVLTDTAERSPTFCIPPFKRWDDTNASDSWAFLFASRGTTAEAWQHLLKRKPRAVEWTENQVREMIGPDDARRRYETIERISLNDIYRFRIGMDGFAYRPFCQGDGAVWIAMPGDAKELISEQLAEAREAGAATETVFFGNKNEMCFPLPKNDFKLDGITRVAVKMLLNALSTCIMVRLGRVMGNYMIYVVPSNLKLIDRATRYVSRLADLPYEKACYLVFDVIEYIEPRMKNDQAYPPVVGMAVIRAREGISNQEAEERLKRSAASEK